MNNKIISIQSKVVYGYVGSNIAELAIQLHGLDVISFPTVLLSAHTGHQPVHGKAVGKSLLDDLMVGIEDISVIKDASCIITGYIGSEEIIQSASDFVQRTKREYPDKFYICDPVMGDMDGGLYLPENVANKLIETLIAHCDILTPNHFETEYILKSKITTINTLLELVKKSELLNNKTLIVTSCNLEDTPADQLETIVVSNGKAERILSPKIPIDTTGTGDLFTSILASQLTIGKDVLFAAKEASKTVGNALDFVVKKGLDEMNAECLLKFVNQK